MSMTSNKGGKSSNTSSNSNLEKEKRGWADRNKVGGKPSQNRGKFSGKGRDNAPPRRG